MKENTVIIKTNKGDIAGQYQDNMMVFKGIPYAKPPVKELRFAPPVAMDVWDGVKECYEYGNCSTQAPCILVNSKPSEDCLYLNVWAPKLDPNKKYPVYFWIHGGGYFNGCGSMEYYDGSSFANKDVIVVTINYRLGALGFLALETLMNKYGTTGNWGMLDQIAALKWVNENIAAFGGDSNNITIGGESAGSFSVSSLVMSPLAKGLFQKAIMQSGNILSDNVSLPFTQAKLEASVDNSVKFAQLFGADDSEKGLEILQNVDAYKLWETGFFSSDITVPSPMAFWHTLDGVVLPKNPLEALKNKEYNKAVYLMGFNEQEGNVFLSENSTLEGAHNFISLVFGDKKDGLNKYYDDNVRQNLGFVSDVVTYAYFKAGTLSMMDLLVSNGEKVYGYEFGLTADGNYPMKNIGPHHAVDILYTFDSFDKMGLIMGPNDKMISKQMNTMWANFITSGNPNVGLELDHKVVWDTYNNNKFYYFNENIECTNLKDREKINDFEKMLNLTK
ncbi:MAG: carboxylesterase family protein [Erysipelotrichaceae bacterium]